MSVSVDTVAGPNPAAHKESQQKDFDTLKITFVLLALSSVHPALKQKLGIQCIAITLSLYLITVYSD